MKITFKQTKSLRGGLGLSVQFIVDKVRIFDTVNDSGTSVRRVAIIVSTQEQVLQFEGYGVVGILGGIWFDQLYGTLKSAPFLLAGMEFDSIEIDPE